MRNILSSSGAQAKLAIGRPNDVYEREADRVADRVVAGEQAPSVSTIPAGGLGASPPAQRAEKDEEEKLQRQAQEKQEEEEKTAQAKLLQCENDEEDSTQAKYVQCEAEPAEPTETAKPDEEESSELKHLQMKVEDEEGPVQAKAGDEEEPVQSMADEDDEKVQRTAEEDKEDNLQAMIQAKEKDEEEAPTAQAKAGEDEEPVQAKQGDEEENGAVQVRGRRPSAKASEEDIRERSGGRPLQPEVRHILESRIDADFTHVRVHDDSRAHAAAKSIGAKAFTHRNNIWLGPGQSQSDLHLMAHEGTHVVQQGAAGKTLPESGSIQRLEDGSAGGEAGAAVTPEEKIKALAAAAKAKAMAEAKVEKSREQVAQEEQKKSEALKEKKGADDSKSKAEQEAASVKGEGAAEGKEPAEGGTAAGDKSGEKAGPKAAKKGKPKEEEEKKRGKEAGKVAGKADKAPRSPDKDPGFLAAVGKAKKEAKGQKEHKPAKDEADAAQQAAESPASELESKAQSNQVDTMDAAETPAFDAAGFKAKLMERIAAMAPKTAEEADDFKDSGKVGELKGEMSGEVDTQKQASQAPMQEATAAMPDSSGIEPKPVTPMEAPDPGPAPSDIHAEKAVPKNKGKSEVETPIKENTQQIGDQMNEAGVTEEQLAKSNEPEFQKALDGKKEAEVQAVSGPAQYRQDETTTIDAAKQDAAVTATTTLAEMGASRAVMTGQLAGSQQKGKSEDEQARAKVASDIQTIYDDTKADVETILSGLDEKVATAFDVGAEAAREVFEDYVDARMTAYKEERYGGWLGWARWGKDKIAGMPDEVNAFYSEGRNRYIKEMDTVIDGVVAIIGGDLTAAKARVADGKAKIAKYVASLPDNLKEVGQQAANDIQEKFDSLESDIDSKQDQLIDDLANKYNENLQAVDARIEELKAANAGLVDAVINAVKGVIETIKKLKAMLDSLLAKIAHVISDIIADPIGFLGNLIKGIKRGFDNFVANIMKHLIGGLVRWLTGALGPMGITIPEDIFSLKGIFTLVMQVLGLTWDYFRGKAVKLLGEPVVKALEVGFELFMIVKTKGLAGLWEYIKEQFSNLKEMVIDEIKSMIIAQVITAGVKWIIGLLNPVGAFIKAAMAIYEIVKFFVERAAQIYEFVNSVVDSIADIVKGNLGGAAQKVETALANSIPLVIGFLASLLGISGLAKKVQMVIGKVRKKIDKAIDKLLMKAKKFAKKIFGKAKAAAGEVVQWWKQRKKFRTKTGEKHELYFKGEEKSAIPMVASNDPKPVQMKLEEFERVAGGPDASDEQKRAKTRIATTKSRIAKDPNAQSLLGDLKTYFELFGDDSTEKKEPVVKRTTGSLGGDTVGLEMSIDWLDSEYEKKHPGSGPRAGVQSNLMDRLITDPLKGRRSFDKYIRGHLLNENLGGEGSANNMFPITGNANSQHLHSTESTVKRWMKIPKRWIWYEVKVRDVSSRLDSPNKEENYVDSAFVCRAILKGADGKAEDSLSTRISSIYHEKHKAERDRD